MAVALAVPFACPAQVGSAPCTDATAKAGGWVMVTAMVVSQPKASITVTW